MSKLMGSRNTRSGKPHTVASALRHKAANHLWSRRPLRAAGNIAAAGAVAGLKGLSYPLVRWPARGVAGAAKLGWKHAVVPSARWGWRRGVVPAGRWLGWGTTHTTRKLLRALYRYSGARWMWRRVMVRLLHRRNRALRRIARALNKILARLSPAQLKALVTNHLRALGRRWGVLPPAPAAAAAAAAPQRPPVAFQQQHAPQSPKAKPAPRPQSVPQPTPPAAGPVAPVKPLDLSGVEETGQGQQHAPAKVPSGATQVLPGQWQPPWDRPTGQPADRYDTDIDGDAADAAYVSSRQAVQPPALSPNTQGTNPKETHVSTATSPRSLSRDERLDMAAAFVIHPAEQGLVDAHLALVSHVPASPLDMVDHLVGLREMYGACAQIVIDNAHNFYPDNLPVKEPVLDALSEIKNGQLANVDYAEEALQAYEIANAETLEAHRNPHPNQEFNDVAEGAYEGVDMGPLRAAYLEAFADTFSYMPQDPPDLRAFFQGLLPMFVELGQQVVNAPTLFPGVDGPVRAFMDKLAGGYRQSAEDSFNTATSYVFTDAFVLSQHDSPDVNQHLSNLAGHRR